MSSQDELRRTFAQMADDGGLIEDLTGNLPAMTGIWPDYPAPIVRQGSLGLHLSLARWGMPTPPQFLTGRRTDPGVTNIRNLAAPHWQRWLGVGHRCLVPFNSFAEPDSRPGPSQGKPIWFALGPDRPLACFAGICTEWTSIRKLKEGEVTVQAFAFLTCEPNREVACVHPKAMPVILTRLEEWRDWLAKPTDRIRLVQRPLPDGELEIVP